MVEHKIEFIFTPPTFGKKNDLCTMNTYSRWGRFAKTKIKHEFQTLITEWCLPEWEDNPYLSAEIEYTILRRNGKNIDSDALCGFTYKILQDMLVLNSYLVDDNKVKVIMNPTLLHVEGAVETSVRVEIHLKERYIMTVTELKLLVNNLQLDLEKVDSDQHVKTASARVRKALGEIKNATPELRRALIILDKK